MRIALDDPRKPDVAELLGTHLAFANEHSPPEDVHALDVEKLVAPDVIFLSARDETGLLGVGALRRLDAQHAEIKSMHTTAAARGRGVGRAMVRHLLDLARDSGCAQVSLETGTMNAFAPARALYESLGFRPCPPFGEYFFSPNSVCMTLRIV